MVADVWKTVLLKCGDKFVFCVVTFFFIETKITDWIHNSRSEERSDSTWLLLCTWPWTSLLFVLSRPYSEENQLNKSYFRFSSYNWVLGFLFVCLYLCILGITCSILKDISCIEKDSRQAEVDKHGYSYSISNICVREHIEYIKCIIQIYMYRYLFTVMAILCWGLGWVFRSLWHRHR